MEQKFKRNFDELKDIVAMTEVIFEQEDLQELIELIYQGATDLS